MVFFARFNELKLRKGTWITTYTMD